MRTEKKILAQFDKWGMNNELVRAAILTSSRANPDTELDFLSDYDIEIYVSDIEPFRKDDRWLAPFGSIISRWPFKPRPTFSEEWITRLILFKDGVRIDFQISDNKLIRPDAYKNGYRVLLDKDNLTAVIQKPTFSEHNIKKPTHEEYDTIVNEFWWNAAYVPKHLWRDELPFAASMMGLAVRDKYLRTVVEWYIGQQYNWLVDTGIGGRRFKHFLDAQTWAEFASTYTGADIEENWQAFFRAVTLFRKLAISVGSKLGYSYPMNLDREMTAYYTRIRNTKREGNSNPTDRTPVEELEPLS